MDLIEDEPRKYPKPVPFAQSALLQPTVPEVSLVLQDNFQPEKKKESFAGTEFQTYNAWRWKHMNGKSDKLCSLDSRKLATGLTDCHSFKDRTFSDIEKRKNEILYGGSDEPRRPLPPRANPVIPKCSELLSPSFDDLKIVDDIPVTYSKVSQSIPTCQDKKTVNCLSMGMVKKVSDDSSPLYNIISEQNKQIEVLQKQIEQLIKLQEVKDKQMAQLLKSQESKEKKIEQLLESLDAKDKEVEQLIKLKDKQDQRLKELLKSEEEKRKENLDLLRKLNEIKQKDMSTVGVMTHIQMFDVSTMTDFASCIKDCCNKKDETPLGEISSIRDFNESNRLDGKDKSISLHSADLPVIPEHHPTPQSSIHVDMQDFPDSSDECESESPIQSNNFFTSSATHSNPLGYTFYNNVLTQVKDIIQNSGPKDDGIEKNGQNGIKKLETEYNCVVGKRGTVQSFHAWDVSERENIPPPNDDRMLYKSPNLCLKDNHSPSDISLKINALAMKYLKQEQISQYNVQQQIPTPCQHDVTIYNVTNLSFGSMRYLDRYKMLPKVVKNHHGEVNNQGNDYSPGQFLQRKKRMSIQENIASSTGNILDINTLNQQPKLL